MQENEDIAVNKPAEDSKTPERKRVKVVAKPKAKAPEKAEQVEKTELAANENIAENQTVGNGEVAATEEKPVEKEAAPAESAAEAPAETAPETVGEVAAADASYEAVAEKEPFSARAKEWLRKKIVILKRKPQRIAFLFFVITSVIYLIGLNTFSPGPVKDFSGQPWLGLSVFVNTLFSILILVLMLNAFPKRGKFYKKLNKKLSVNIVMLVLVFVFAAAMIFFDVLYYKQLLGCIAGNESKFFSTMEQAEKYKTYWSSNFSGALDSSNYKSYLAGSFTLDIVHIVFLGISVLLLATLPLYKKLIMKINTRKEVASTEIKETIDTEDE